MVGRRVPAYPAWAGPAERLRALLGYAIQAPSRFNAQPWLFEIEGDEVRLFADARRALKAADPLGREAAIACGAALENLRIASAHFGHHLAVEVREPRGGGPLAVARLRDERRTPSPADEELFEAIPRRRTAVRFDANEVSHLALAALGGEMGADATLRHVPRWLAGPVADLVAQADAIQWSSAKFRAEHATWTRPARRPGEGAPPPPARPARSAFFRWLLRRRIARHDRAELDRRSDAHTRTLLLLSSREDRPRDWIAAGRATQRLLLRATARGLAVSFLSQPIEIPDLRRRLRREVGEPGHPQVLLRVGYGPEGAATPRRPLELVLRSFSTEVAVDIDVPAAAPRSA
jgi:nitroreductase